ncbi:MAG TPA: DNA primase [Clostridiaceae bacterium]|nr:DNA primase [Clostridiaceae bacterium]
MSNYYPDEIIEEIRISNDIVDVVMEYVKLERKGKDYFGLCPFHKEKTPSFSVVPTKQIFYCFGCGRGGNVIHFIMNIENLEYIEAVKMLADRAGIQLPEGDSREEKEKAFLKREITRINTEAARFFFEALNSPRGEKAREYLRKRKIKEQTVKRFGIGYAYEAWDELYKHLLAKGFNKEHIIKSGLVIPGKKGGCYDRFRDRLIFPIFDVRGNVIAFGGRVLDSSTPKYLNSPETVLYNKGKNLYALNFAKNSGEKSLLIVEGYMDVISLHQNGIINAVASLGTAMTESQGRLLKKYAEEVIISFDSDAAGQAAAMRGLDLLNDIGCNVRVLVIPDGKDPDEYVRENGAEAFRKIINNSISLIEYKIRILKKQIDTGTPEGKIKFLNKIANVLSKIDNNVEIEVYIKKLAEEYDISPESLYSEVYRRIKPKENFRKISANQENNKDNKVKLLVENEDDKLVQDERFIIAILCTDNSVYKYVRDKITVDTFTDSENRKLARVVLERLENNKGIAPGELLNIVDKKVANDFARIINKECPCDDNKKAILGKIRSIELYKLKKRQMEILELLKQKDSLTEGDVEKLGLELKSIASLIKEKKSG